MSAGSTADLALERIATLLTTGRYGRSLDVREATSSTNDDAGAAARAGVPAGHVIVADHQRDGRGARGRSWASPPGSDLYVSIVERLPLQQAQLPPLTLAVGLAVAEAADALVAAERTRVKWPNDVWLDGRKCAGILIEATMQGSEVGPVVIGVGLNVNRTEWPEELTDIATSLRQHADAPLDRARVLAQLLASVERRVDDFVAGGLAAIHPALSARLALVGQRVRCDDTVGTLAGIADSGALRVETANGVRELVTGTLRAL